MNSFAQRLKIIFAEILPFMNPTTKQGETIYAYAKTQLGKDASPLNLASYVVACAESVSTILVHLGFLLEIITGTWTLEMALKSAPEWVEVKVPIRGDILLYATGEGGLNGVTAGHVMIIGDDVPGVPGDKYAMSNNSLNGIFDNHLTLASARARYRDLGGYPEHIFRRII